MEAGSGRYISIRVYRGDSTSTVRVPLVTTREERERLCFGYMGYDKTGEGKKGGRKAEDKMHKLRRYYIYTLGWGTSMACTRETHQNAKRERTGRGKRKKWNIVEDKQIDS